MDSALSYYEVSGADWERQMLIRLRALGGPAAVAEEFGDAIRPFVYRRSIDASAIGAVRKMKDRIESERLEAGRDLGDCQRIRSDCFLCRPRLMQARQHLLQLREREWLLQRAKNPKAVPNALGTQ